ncbi:MAG TPA: hypothetical protein ENN65_04535 [Candidatus Hydrogenedentes bacterium]|nr:hypothetical protein [Candidatus Hydrogenedentota bacterium]
MPSLPRLAEGGFSIVLGATFDALIPNQAILNSRDAAGRGIVLQVSAENTLELRLSDGEHKAAWDVDPGMVRPGARHHIAMS